MKSEPSTWRSSLLFVGIRANASGHYTCKQSAQDILRQRMTFFIKWSGPTRMAHLTRELLQLRYLSKHTSTLWPVFRIGSPDERLRHLLLCGMLFRRLQPPRPRRPLGRPPYLARDESI